MAPSTHRSGSINERYQRIGGFTSGFDYMRLLLAVAVIVAHSFPLAYGPKMDLVIWGTECRIFVAPILLMFFALSGFLVAGSLKRNPSLASFLTLRVIRLVPALAVEVLLCALLLGPLLTNLPWSEYFSDRNFFSYFGNVVGRIKYHLPGVFTDNPLNVVNVSLWTVPYELECYLVLVALWITKALRTRSIVLGVTAILIAAGTCSAFVNFEEAKTINGFTHMPRPLIAAFLVGVCLSLYSDRVILDWRVAVLAVAGLVSATLIYQTAYLATLFSGYLVVYLGMLNPPRKGFLFSGDYSYGLYLFGFPIQQTYIYLFPGHREWYLAAAAGIVLGLVYASFSWWCVEKPILGKRKLIVAKVEGFFDSARAKLFPARA